MVWGDLYYPLQTSGNVERISWYDTALCDYNSISTVFGGMEKRAENAIFKSLSSFGLKMMITNGCLGKPQKEKKQQNIWL